MREVLDVNFDSRAEKFLRNIHGTLRGAIRTAVLKRDLLSGIPAVCDAPLRILDAGGGAGQMAIWLAEQHSGHRVVLCDLSEKLLAHAKRDIAAAGLTDQIEVANASLQTITERSDDKYDLITCHAVLEWIGDQSRALRCLASLLNPEGTLSLMYFNKHAQTFRALINGNFKEVRGEGAAESFPAMRPVNPCEPKVIEAGLRNLGLNISSRSGIRCFYDSMPEGVRRRFEAEDLVDMELLMSEQEPYLELARYIHVMAVRQPDQDEIIR